MSDPTTLTELDVRAGLAALVGVQDQKANFEEKAVWCHIETTHLVEAVTAHHQCNETDSFTQHIDVVNYPVDSCLRDVKNIMCQTVGNSYHCDSGFKGIMCLFY